MLAWSTKLRQWWRGDEPDAQPAIPRTTPAAGVTSPVTPSVTPVTPSHEAAKAEALRAERVELPLRRRKKRAPASGVERQRKYRAKMLKEDPDFQRREREHRAAYRQKQKAAKAAAAAQVGDGAAVINLLARRAQRAAEVPPAWSE
jgi:hypothetical protein